VVSTNRGVPLVHDKSSKAGAAFRNMAARLNGEGIPPDEDESHGLLGRMKRLIWN
jgi:septum site-determining protein MinD